LITLKCLSLSVTTGNPSRSAVAAISQSGQSTLWESAYRFKNAMQWSKSPGMTHTR
jgi:hypothetical protein